MFDIGFPELLLVAIVALLVLGPERLPQALRTLGLWLGRMRRSFNAVKNEVEREIGMDEIRRQLHNEAVLEELKRIERDVRATADEAAGRPGRAPATTGAAGSESAGEQPAQATELQVGAPRGADDAGPVGDAPERIGAKQDG
jgi:sec-independent protein translocase protein TatB